MVPPFQYLNVWRRQKKTTQVRFMIAIIIVVVPWEAVSKVWITLTRRGCTLVGG